jgi:hypothetical protein
MAKESGIHSSRRINFAGILSIRQQEILFHEKREIYWPVDYVLSSVERQCLLVSQLVSSHIKISSRPFLKERRIASKFFLPTKAPFINHT